MSENSERKGMAWARQRAAKEPRYIDYYDDDGSPRAVVGYPDAELILDDEWRALVRAALQGFLSNPSLRLSGDDHAAGITEASALLADAVLARYDEEVRDE